MIEFASVGKTFRDGTAAVVDLSLTVPPDKITVIVGPSGCGKTTALRMINRMLEPTSGKILWDGTPLKSRRKTALRRQMGYVTRSAGLFPHRTVLENVDTVPGLLGWGKTKTRKRSIELLDAVGLDRKLANRFPAELTGGQQQRVGVARALAADPLVLLMDEPFSTVDPVVRAELHELVSNLQRELSKTIVLTTHDIDEAFKLGDQVAILGVGGTLAQVGTPQQLLDEPADDFVEALVGKDRGYRALSFVNGQSLSLGRVQAVRDPESARPGEPTLVVDGDARPLGWADTEHPGRLHALGTTFDPEHDNLRAALDSALTSPVGLAVAVTRATGRYAGVVTAADVLAQVTQSRAAVAETLSVREAEAALPAPVDTSGSDQASADGTVAEDADTVGADDDVTTEADQTDEMDTAAAGQTDDDVTTEADQTDEPMIRAAVAPQDDVAQKSDADPESDAVAETGTVTVLDLPADDLTPDDVPDGVPVEDLPVEDLPVEDLPVGDLPVGDLATDDLPLDERPVEESQPRAGTSHDIGADDEDTHDDDVPDTVSADDPGTRAS